jgi:hypothetical protein
MPVIHDKFVFVHIQKTAGTSLKMMFQDTYPGELRVTYPHHVRLSEIDEELLQNKFKFTIVRNPFARQYSYYKNDCRAKMEDGRKIFDAFDNTFYQQYFLDDVNCLDKVYQTENFDNMIDDLSNRFSFKFKQTFHYGREHVFDRDYSIHYSKRMIDILIEREPVIFKMFDYKF